MGQGGQKQQSSAFLYTARHPEVSTVALNKRSVNAKNDIMKQLLTLQFYMQNEQVTYEELINHRTHACTVHIYLLYLK